MPNHLTAWDVTHFIEGELEASRARTGLGPPGRMRGLCALGRAGAGRGHVGPENPTKA